MLLAVGAKPCSNGFNRPVRTSGPDDEIRLVADSHAFDGERLEEAAVVGVQRTRDAHVALATLPVAKRPDVARRRVFVGEAHVRREIFRDLRLAVTPQIRRRRATDEPCRADLAADQVLAADIADPHRDVESLLDEIGGAVRQLDIEAHLRVAHDEFGDRRSEMARAERDRGGEPQRAARRDGAGVRRLLGLLQVGQELHAALVKRATAFGQGQAACRAIEKPRVEMRLELGDLARDRRHGDAEALRGAGKAPGFDDRGEGADGVEAIHGRRRLLHNSQ